MRYVGVEYLSPLTWIHCKYSQTWSASIARTVSQFLLEGIL